ncbi:MAG: deoxyribodipyrimidine photo-lyase, partial [Actinomycetota bacterium]|nr:deoxyribodipyrimidine photo-lyase [Actinomycetota bacterium]
MKNALLWFRRDLRVHDHPALRAAGVEFERLVPVFVLDDALLHGRFASASRTQFLLGCLRALDDALRERGSALVVRHGTPERELVALAAEAGAEAVLWTSDVAPYARARDGRVTEALGEAGVEARPSGGNYVVDVSRPRTKDGRPYSVFSPFWRSWLEVERRDVLRAPRTLPPLPSKVRRGRLPGGVRDLGIDEGGVVAEPLVEPGEAAARKAVARWLDGGLEHYADRQDAMARHGTSRLSPYLRWGCLSPRELEERARGRGGKSAGAWVRQLCWREFYAHV